jgi:UDP-N-acetylmuramate--alanine ligase
VKRRFTKVGEVEGVTIIDDYGHHPVEIRAVLAAAREGAEGSGDRRRAAHRYTRLQNLMEDFQGASTMRTSCSSPRSTRGRGADRRRRRRALVEGLKQRGHRMAKAVGGPEDLCRQLRDIAGRGDMVICLGAGDITKWAAGWRTASVTRGSTNEHGRP